jgi:hypothetical protein
MKGFVEKWETMENEKHTENNLISSLFFLIAVNYLHF